MLYNIFSNKENKFSFILIVFSVISSYFVDDTSHFIAFCSFILLFLFILKFDVNILKTSSFRFLGTISYSLYLLHQVIGYEIMNLLYKYNLNSYLIITLTLLFILILAHINWKLFEFLLSKKLRTFLTRIL